REALEPAASVEVETAESRVEQEKDSSDADLKDLSREEGAVSEATDPDAKRDYQRDSVFGAPEPESRRDYQEKDGDTATELPREVVLEITEPSGRADDPDGDKSDLRETLDPDIRDGSAVEDIKDEVGSFRDSTSTYAVPSEDAAVIDKHYSGDDESPAGMVSTDDVPGIESGVEASRVEGKDYTGEGEAPAEAASSDVATEDKVVSAGDEALEGELGAEGVAVREALEPAASVEVETAESRVEQEKDSSDADLKDLSREEGAVSEVTEPESKGDYQERDTDVAATELPREVVSETTEPGSLPNDQDGDKSYLSPEKSGSDLGDHGVEDDAKHEVGDESSSRGISTDDVPGIDSGVEASRVEGKDYTGEGEAPVEAASSDVATEVVSAGDKALEGELGVEVTAVREALEPAASVEVETAESRVEQERDSSDADVKDLSREEGTISEVTDPDAKRDYQKDSVSEATEPESRRDYQEKDSGDGDDAAREREVVSEIAEPSGLPNDQDGDKSYLSPEKSGSDLGDHGVEGDAKHEVGDESSSRGISTDDVPGIESGVEESRVEGKDYTGEGEAPAEAASSDEATEDKVVSAGDEALEGELGAEGVAVREALEPAASVESETAESRIDQTKDRGDGYVKDLPREEGTISEVTDPDAKRDYQEKDGDTAKELPREVVPEAIEYGTRPDDPDGDKIDSRSETLDPNIGDGSAIEDEVRSSRDSDTTDGVQSKESAVIDKHDSSDDESPVGMVSTEDVPGIDSGVEASRVEGKDYTGEGETSAEVPSSDVAPEVVSAGDEALEGELGAEVKAAREALEPAASVELETGESRVEQERASGDADVKDLSREEGTISEVTDPDAKREDQRDSVFGATEPESRRDYQEKDGDTATELPREVVPEATEYGTRPDNLDGDQRDLSPAKSGSDLGDHGVEGDAKHEVGDESSSREVSTEDVPGIDSGVEASRVESKDHTVEGEPLAEVPSSDVAPEVVSAGDEALEGELGAEVKAAREALEPAASV
ncbi:midas domain-containing protein, partial [Anaplasma phagocytophilum]|uniref:hypothetical protein n=1 Tax=Anaplasma phagocytophilum TaxID=948 RepID=UPI000B22DCBA